MAFTSLSSRLTTSPHDRLFDDLDYIADPTRSPPHTLSPISSVSILSPSDLSENWSKMSHNSQSRTPTVATSDLEIESISRHPAYYIPSGDVVFLAGALLFRVHRYFFVRESVKFRDMLSVVTPNGMELMGSSDSRAIPLSDVTKEEFESFLWLFYNDDYEYEAPLERWSAILRLAHMWQFPKVKLLATRKMDKFEIEPVDKTVMARDFEVDPSFGWLEQAYASLGAREEALSKLEGARLGLNVVVLLALLREKIRKRWFEKEKSALRDEIPTPPRRSFYGEFESPIMPPKSPAIDYGIPVPQSNSASYTDEDLADVRIIFGF